MISDEFPAYNVHTISSTTTVMSASSSWTLSYHLVLFPRSQHFTVTSVSMLCAVRRARLYVTTARPAKNTRSDGALVAHTARSSRTMGARAGYAMFQSYKHTRFNQSCLLVELLRVEGGNVVDEVGGGEGKRPLIHAIAAFFVLSSSIEPF